MLAKDREGEKNSVNKPCWTAAIYQRVRLFIEKTAAGTRIINIVCTVSNQKEINLFYSILVHR